MNKTLVLILGLALVGCGGAEDGAFEEESFDSLSAEIRDGTPVPMASQIWKVTVAVGGCTGTIIGPRHILTAAHCNIRDGANVYFYRGNAQTSVTRKVHSVYQPWGVTNTDLVDLDGKFADYSVLYLTSAIPPVEGYFPALLATGWPGNNVDVDQVGTGKHDEQANPNRLMEFRRTKTYSSSDSEGHVLVESTTDSGDSGGPIFNADGFPKRLYGVNYGDVFEWAWHGKLTSTAFHFWDILRAAGLSTKSSWDYAGNDIDNFSNISVRDCASRCMANNSCRAYTLVGSGPGIQKGTCFLKATVGAGGNSRANMWSGSRSSTGTCSKPSGDAFCRL